MTSKLSTMALGTMLGIGALSFAGAGAQAAAMLPLSATAEGQANAASNGIVQVKHKKKHNNWDDSKKWHKRYGKRCNYYNDNCRHHYRGRYYETPWWTLPLIVGGGIAASNYYDNDYYDSDFYDYDDDYGYDGGLGSRHIRYCLNKYQSYNPRNNTWVAYSGRVKKCYSPYL
jgi:BA14K-like protein